MRLLKFYYVQHLLSAVPSYRRVERPKIENFHIQPGRIPRRAAAGSADIQSPRGRARAPAPPTLFAAEAELHEDEFLALAENVSTGGGHLGELLHQVGLRSRRRGGGRLHVWRGHDGRASAARGRRRRGCAHGRSAGGRQRRAWRLHRGRARVTSARARDRVRWLNDRRASRPRLFREAYVTILHYWGEIIVLPVLKISFP